MVGQDAFTVYVGAEAQRIGHLAVQTGPDSTDVLDVAQGVSRFGAKAIGTLGLGDRFELQTAVPWYRSGTSRTDDPLCVTLALGACETTDGIGLIETRVKGLALDEFFGAPVSVSAGLDLRFGLFTATERERVTNLGEGTLDAGSFVNVGRTGSLGKGYWSGWLEGLFRYRVPNTASFPQLKGDRSVPGSEFGGAAELVLGPTPSFAIGPNASALYRPFGVDFYQTDLTDPDRFAALRVANVRVGATAVVRSGNTSLSASYLQTVYGFNNPNDTFVVNVGLQFRGHLPGVTDG